MADNLLAAPDEATAAYRLREVIAYAERNQGHNPPDVLGTVLYPARGIETKPQEVHR